METTSLKADQLVSGFMLSRNHTTFAFHTPDSNLIQLWSAAFENKVIRKDLLANYNLPTQIGKGSFGKVYLGCK